MLLIRPSIKKEVTHIMEDKIKTLSPRELRELFRTGELSIPTAGLCPDYIQANLVILKVKYADDYEEFLRKNPRPCPVLEIIRGERPISKVVAPGADIVTDFPLYRIYRDGKFIEDVKDVSDLWEPDMMAALVGCSLTFEASLVKAGIYIAHFENQTRVPMYDTNIQCDPAGPFGGGYVVSMRPMPEEMVQKAIEITEPLDYAHGGPVHIGDPEAIGISDIMHPDYGDPPVMREGDVPVFWACGVTAQAAAMRAKPELVIAHSPGYMLITDVTIEQLEKEKGRL